MSVHFTNIGYKLSKLPHMHKGSTNKLYVMGLIQQII
jgi:hypothetical protein